MFDSFKNKLMTPVAPGQKVAQNQREKDAQKSFVISWKQKSATINQLVQLEVVANMPVQNKALLGINILFNNQVRVGSAEIVSMNGKQITAQWTVRAHSSGLYTAGSYYAQITYNGTVMGVTALPLTIASGRDNRDMFTNKR